MSSRPYLFCAEVSYAFAKKKKAEKRYEGGGRFCTVTQTEYKANQVRAL